MKNEIEYSLEKLRNEMEQSRILLNTRLTQSDILTDIQHEKLNEKEYNLIYASNTYNRKV